MRWLGWTSALFLIQVGGAGCADGRAGPPDDLDEDLPDARLVPGDRLVVQAWERGVVSLPWRFRDVALDHPCSVLPFGDAYACVPTNPTAVAIGAVDTACSGLALVDQGAYAEGDLVTWMESGEVRGVYRVGAPLDDGDVHWAGADCRDGAAYVLAFDTPRRALVPLADSELVRFVKEVRRASADIEVDVWLGDDGATMVGTPRGSGGDCMIVGDRCAVQASPVFPFQSAFADASCSAEAFWAQSDCGPAGEVVVAVDECGGAVSLGVTGGPVEGEGYRRMPDGACGEDDVFSGTAAGEDRGSASACLQSLAPMPMDDLPPLTVERVQADGLVLVRYRAGGLVLAEALQLAEGFPCTPHRADGDTVRCVPSVYVQPATSRDGSMGSFTSVDACAPETEPGPALYTFAAGAPCSLRTTVVWDDGDELGRVVRVERFVPWDGPVFVSSWDEGYEVCVEGDGQGWFVPEETSLTDLPELSLVDGSTRQ
jgi:hypothetical protein